MSQILAAAGPYTLTKIWMVDGTPTDVGAVTIGITDGNGDTVVSAGTSTTNAGDGVYTYSLADQPNPDQLTITWTRSSSGADLIDRIEIIGNWLFTEAQARAFKAKADAPAALKPLGSATEYPDAVIAAARASITDDLERWTSRSWIPRYARVEFSGTGSYLLEADSGICRTADGFQLNRPGRFNDIAKVLTCTVDGETLDTDNVTHADGVFYRTDTVWPSATNASPFNVVIEYVYGLPNIVNSADRMALLLAVDRLVPSEFTDRALTVDSDYGTIRLVQPGGVLGNVSRLPEVNAWVAENSLRMPFA